MKKEKRVEVRMDEFEYKAVKEIAALSGCTVSSCFRQMALSGEIKKRKVVSEPSAALIREVAKIGNNLNQIARWCNSHKSGADVVQVLRQLEVIEDAIRGVKDVD